MRNESTDADEADIDDIFVQADVIYSRDAAAGFQFCFCYYLRWWIIKKSQNNRDALFFYDGQYFSSVFKNYQERKVK